MLALHLKIEHVVLIQSSETTCWGSGLDFRSIANLRLPVEAPNPGNPVGRDCRGRLLPSKVERHDIPPWCLTDSPSGQKVRQVMPARSAKTGRYITKAAAARSPRTSVVSKAGQSSSTGHRSAITGRYITPATAKRHPDTTIAEGGR